jgi:hypothetical protein
MSLIRYLKIIFFCRDDAVKIMPRRRALGNKYKICALNQLILCSLLNFEMVSSVNIILKIIKNIHVVLFKVYFRIL